MRRTLRADTARDPQSPPRSATHIALGPAGHAAQHVATHTLHWGPAGHAAPHTLTSPRPSATHNTLGPAGRALPHSGARGDTHIHSPYPHPLGPRSTTQITLGLCPDTPRTPHTHTHPSWGRSGPTTLQHTAAAPLRSSASSVGDNSAEGSAHTLQQHYSTAGSFLADVVWRTKNWQ